jgi:bifunctional non-homologous end joining protein LigD
MMIAVSNSQNTIKMSPRRRRRSASTQSYANRIAHRGIRVEPKLLAEIEYRAKSAEEKVRHPF